MTSTTSTPDELGAAFCAEFTLHDHTGRQPDQIVKGKEQAELRAMTLMLWYPESRFQIIPNKEIADASPPLG